MNRCNKGVIFTIDAIIAIITAIAFLSGSLFFLSQSHTVSWVELDLSQLGMDSLTTLELTGDLNWTVQNDYNTSTFKEFFNVMLEQQTCAQIRLYNTTSSTSQQLITYYTKPNCTLANYTKSATSRRLFVNQNDIMMAEMEVWYG